VGLASTIRGKVRCGTPQQGDRSTTRYNVLDRVSFFYARLTCPADFFLGGGVLLAILHLKCKIAGMSPNKRNPGFIPRALEPTLRQAVADFPVVVLTGPRQSGKTTLLRHLFSASHEYVSLDVPDIRAVAVSDPRSFLALHAPPVIFDEIQYAPELLA
jgi:hypothetical protein